MQPGRRASRLTSSQAACGLRTFFRIASNAPESMTAFTTFEDSSTTLVAMAGCQQEAAKRQAPLAG